MDSVPSGYITIVYQCLHSMAPAYLAELCLPITLSASCCGGLQSATTSNLVIPCCRLSTYGTRAFNVAGPVCWNSLPDYLKSSDLSFKEAGSCICASDWFQNHRPWMTLNGRYALYCSKNVSFKAHCEHLNEDRPIPSSTKM